MSPENGLSEQQVAAVRQIAEDGDAMVEALRESRTTDEILCRVSELLDATEGQTFPRLGALALLDRDHAERIGALKEITESEEFPDEPRENIHRLHREMEGHTDVLWEVLTLAMTIETDGEDGWGRRTVSRRIEIGTNVPLLRMKVQAGRDPSETLFDSEESSYAFIRNATGLLFSVKETYRECNEHDVALPRFLLLKDRWALRKLMEVVIELCECRDLDFDELAREAKEELREEDAQ